MTDTTEVNGIGPSIVFVTSMSGFCMKYHVSCAYGKFQEKSAEPSVYSSYFLQCGRYWDLDIHARKHRTMTPNVVPNSLPFGWQSFLFRGPRFVFVDNGYLYNTCSMISHTVWVSL